MPRKFETGIETSDNAKSLSKHSEDPHAKLARLRAEYGFKVPLTPEQLGEDDKQAKREWGIKEHAAYVEVANDRGQRNSPNSAISLGHGPDGYGLRGGVINGKLNRYTEYLQTDERTAFTSGAALLQQEGRIRSDLSSKEHEAFRLYDAIRYLDRHQTIYSNEEVYAHLAKKREEPLYKKAYHPGSQESRVMTFTEMLKHEDETEDLDDVIIPALKKREEQGCSSNDGNHSSDAKTLLEANRSLKKKYSQKEWWKGLE